MKKRLNLIKTRKTSGFDALKNLYSLSTPIKVRKSLDTHLIRDFLVSEQDAGMVSYLIANDLR